MKESKYINEKTRIFLQEMREYRNKITYEGFFITSAYIEQHTNTILQIIRDLRE